MFRISTFLLCCCLALGACAKNSPNQQSRPDDFVSITLGDAAEQAHGELAMLAKLRGQGLQPLLPSQSPDLDKPVSVSWTGPADGALKEICLQLGYRYREMGSPSAQAVNVIIHGLDRPAYELLEDIAWQIQPQALVRVDGINRTITLARTSEVKS